MLTEKQILDNKDRIVSLLNSVDREGIRNVIEYLDENDFYKLPSSLKRHHNWKGGLAQHCIGVYERLCKTGENLDRDSVIITSLLHDICKTGKIYEEKGEWKEKNDEKLQIKGHGERSVKLLEDVCGFQLKDEERRAIRWHMGGYNIPKDKLRDFFAVKKSELWRLLYNADCYDARHNGK